MAAILVFTEALEPDFESQLPNRESNVLTDNDEDKLEMKAKTEDAIVVHYFTLSFEDE